MVKKLLLMTKPNLKKPGLFLPEIHLRWAKKKFTWTMDKNGSRVVVKRGNKVIIIANVLTLTAHQLIFTRPDEGMIVTYTLTK